MNTYIKNTLIYSVIISLLLSVLFFTGCSGGDTPSDTVHTDTATDTDVKSEKSNDTIFIPIEKSTADDTPPPTSQLTEKQLDDAVLGLTRDMGAEYTDRIVFICDCTTYGIKSYGMLSEGRQTGRVLTGAGMSYLLCNSDNNLIYREEDGSLVNVGDEISALAPDICVIAAGGDDIARGASKSSFKLGVQKLITEIKTASPDTAVICISVLPGSNGSGNNIYDVEQYNKYMHEAAAECGAYYIDAASEFAAPDGYLRSDCDGGSSHLNTVGIKALLDIIRTHSIPSQNIT